MPEVIASDGLPARDNGTWAEAKLSFLDQYGPPALQATQKKLQRYYVDLFAGPGMNVDDRRTGREFVGSALRALRMHASADERLSFTHAILVNRDRRDYEALRERVHRLAGAGQSRVPLGNIRILEADANFAIPRIMQGIDPGAYVFMLADIEAPDQWPWSSMREIRAQGHRSVDLAVLFPLGMAINRLFPYDPSAAVANASVLTSFFGTEEWRSLAERRLTDAQSPELRRALEELYITRIRALGWKDVRVVRDIRFRGNQQLYKLIFATNHPAGENIAKWETRENERKDQRSLFDDLK